MKIGIFYFTGTGNTAFIAEILKGEFGAENPTEIFNIEFFPDGIKHEQLEPFELFVFGAPIYAFNAPKLFIQFLHKLPKTKGKRAFLFLNAGGDALAGLEYPASILRKKDYNLTNQAVFLMPSNVLVENKNLATGEIILNLFGLKYKQNIHQMAEKCRTQIKEVVNQILKGEPTLVHVNSAARLVTFLCRPMFFYLGCPTFEWFVNADKECTLCNICVKGCPVGNIRIEGGKVKFGSACNMCYRCINICPKQAIRYRWPFGILDNKEQYTFPVWKPPQHNR